MSAQVWLEVTGISGEAVCTLAEFRAANEGISDEEIMAIEALKPGEHVAIGAAAPEMIVERCSSKRAAAFDEIAAICERAGGTFEVQIQHDEDEAPLPFSIWVAAPDGAGSDIVGAGWTLDEAIAEAITVARAWKADS